MKTRKIVFILGLYFCLSGCSRYQTFFGPTETLSNSDRQPVYRLHLGDTPDDSIFALLPRYSDLRMLDLSGKRNIDLTRVFASIPQPDQLKVLLLDSLDLKQLPDNIRRFSQLEQLSLNGNPDLMHPKTFVTLKSLPLEFLNLQHNYLQEVPAGLKYISTLRDLNLSYNRLQLDTNFDSLVQLTDLKSLWLTGNQLQALPHSLFSLTQLCNLYIEHNQLTAIPEDIQQLKNVWIIHAGHNQFTELPAAFARMPSLLLLHSNNCKIRSVSSIYETKRSNVKGLILDQNPLDPLTKERLQKRSRRYFLLSVE